LRSIPLGPKVFASRRLGSCLQDPSDLPCPFPPPSASLTFKPRQLSRPWSTPKPGLSTPRLSSWPFSILRSRNPSFHSFRNVRVALPCLPGSLTLGFGYPLDELSQSLNPWKPFSAPHTLGLLLSKLFSSIAIERKFPLSLSALALFTQTLTAWIRRFSGLIPRWKPYPFSLPDGLDPVGALAPSGLLTSQALPPGLASLRSLSLEYPPLGVASSPLSRRRLVSPSGSFRSTRHGFSLYRAPACLAFLPLVLPFFSNPWLPRTIFSSRSSQHGYPH